jgi:SP family general alpha glucoside:H+ symporter-like MFS transporter
VPECSGRSFAEIDWLFEQRVPARKFASTDVDVFGDTEKHETGHFEKLEGNSPVGGH